MRARPDSATRSYRCATTDAVDSAVDIALRGKIHFENTTVAAVAVTGGDTPVVRLVRNLWDTVIG